MPPHPPWAVGAASGGGAGGRGPRRAPAPARRRWRGGAGTPRARRPGCTADTRPTADRCRACRTPLPAWTPGSAGTACGRGWRRSCGLTPGGGCGRRGLGKRSRREQVGKRPLGDVDRAADALVGQHALGHPLVDGVGVLAEQPRDLGDGVGDRLVLGLIARGNALLTGQGGTLSMHPGLPTSMRPAAPAARCWPTSITVGAAPRSYPKLQYRSLSTSIDTYRLGITLLLTAAALGGGIPPRAWANDFSEGDVDEAAWKDFGEWVEQLRERSGLTVGELAERAGVSRIWLQVLRKGGRRIEGEWRAPNPKNDALARVARALDVPVEEMFARAGRGTPPSASGAEGQEASSQGGAETGSMERIRELEERVARTEQEMAELRQLVEKQGARRAKSR